MKYKSNTHPNTHSNSRMLQIIILLLAIVIPSLGQDLNVQVRTTSINALSHYSFILNFLLYSVDSGATLAITFPNEYSSTTIHNGIPYSSYDPSTLGDYCWPLGTCSTTLSVSGRTFFIDGIFTKNYDHTLDGFFMQFSILNIRNPDSLTAGVFAMTIFKGSTVYYPPSTGPTSTIPTFIPSTIPYSTSVSTPSIWATSSLTLTLTPDTLIDTFNLNLPSLWVN